MWIQAKRTFKILHKEGHDTCLYQSKVNIERNRDTRGFDARVSQEGDWPSFLLSGETKKHVG